MTMNATRGTTTRKGWRLGRVDRRLLAGLVTVVAVAAFLAQAALAGPPAPVVPDGIQPSAGNKPFLVGHAVGVQIYTCNGVAWSFVAPRANLFADNGQLIVTHFAGPSWQARDGSTVVGTLVNRATVDSTAIQWLLLSASPAPDSKPGRLDRTTFIQRVNTTGGLAPPASECTAATAGTQAEVPYTADYYFWK
jgi:FtsP/CotA-like multicopper oxidase with cupredoxin domain